MNGERRARGLSDSDLERELKAALLMDSSGGVPNELRIAVAAVRHEERVVTDRGRHALATLRTALATAAALAVIAAAVGAGWTLRGHIAAPAATATQTGRPTPYASPTQAPPSPSPMPGGRVAYTVIHCLPGDARFTMPDCTTSSWIAAGDGSDAHVLPGVPLGWSADGSRLLLQGASLEGNIRLILADATGSQVSTLPVPCTDTSIAATKQEIVPGKQEYVCTTASAFALSPDGSRVAFVRTYTDNLPGGWVASPTVVAVLDLTTGRSTELTATRTTNPPQPPEGNNTPFQCNAGTKLRTCQGDNGNPRWSPDGRRIAFERQGMAFEPGAAWSSAALFVVDADGGNLRRVTPAGLYAFDPSWSPDGTRLVFTNDVEVVNAAHTSQVGMKYDIYSIDVDGTGLTRLTDDGISAVPGWTTTGRVVFIREIGKVYQGGPATAIEHGIVDADGRNGDRLGGSLAELTAVGCMTCVYAADSTGLGVLPRAYWQPAP